MKWGRSWQHDMASIRLSSTHENAILSSMQLSYLVKVMEAKKESATQVDDLHRVIGQLTVERDFLVRKLNH